jgi:hypothetical protein
VATLDFDELGESIVDVLRRNVDFVNAMGGDDSVIRYSGYSYPAKCQLYEVLEQMIPPAALLSYSATDFISRSNGIIHQYVLTLMPRGCVGPVLKALRDGKIDGDLPLKFYQFQPDGHAIDITRSYFRPILIRDQSQIDLHQVLLQVTETGADNV